MSGPVDLASLSSKQDDEWFPLIDPEFVWRLSRDVVMLGANGERTKVIATVLPEVNDHGAGMDKLR
jgi:hypothetical protein